jgi:DNA-directed RNA polymerase subunit RPC12/RpoP
MPNNYDIVGYFCPGCNKELLVENTKEAIRILCPNCHTYLQMRYKRQLDLCSVCGGGLLRLDYDNDDIKYCRVCGSIISKYLSKNAQGNIIKEEIIYAGD